ncbi:hypothetical protein BpHYR1_047420 [Brachionus plicatilis]|uniref:Uncharacterized protein n=1 Tax=Brachionus plicatilis TaxID=10195 RepID=A0A3M7T1P0_BRAPC|nr:hypothetical protein BpHYR1_047420 [Brachionus plicatilis]
MVEGLQLTEATQYITQLDSVKWTRADTRKIQEGEKRFYTCLKGCPKRLFLLLNAESENVSVFVSNDEHQHEETNKEASTTLQQQKIPAGVDTNQPSRDRLKKSVSDFQATHSKKRAALNNNQNDADHFHESRNKRRKI